VCNGSELCAAGVCAAGTALSCDDGDVCTYDSCAEPGGCTHSAIAACCHTATDCDDGIPCTTDQCNAAHQCIHTSNCVVDAGGPDAGNPDAGHADASDVVDAVSPPTDASTDAPHVSDAVATDAPDAPTGDSSIGSDSGVADTGGSPTQNSSCHCATPGQRTPGSGMGWLGAAVALVAVTRRRRRT
jgi:MYXO-CTERM domain-containing protein